MPNYTLTKKALEDLSQIWNYTFEVWSETQADTYYYMILDSCEGLATGIVMGRRYQVLNKDILGYKIGQHIIFYRRRTRNKIEVVRILHRRMDLKNRIQE